MFRFLPSAFRSVTSSGLVPRMTATPTRNAIATPRSIAWYPKRLCSSQAPAQAKASESPELLDDSDQLDTISVAGEEIGQIPSMKYIEFNCNVCNYRVAKTFSNHSYTKGVVIVKCSGCKNLHLIADNLGFTGYDEKNIEQIAANRGQVVTTSWDGELIQSAFRPPRS